MSGQQITFQIFPMCQHWASNELPKSAWSLDRFSQKRWHPNEPLCPEVCTTILVQLFIDPHPLRLNLVAFEFCSSQHKAKLRFQPLSYSLVFDESCHSTVICFVHTSRLQCISGLWLRRLEVSGPNNSWRRQEYNSFSYCKGNNHQPTPTTTKHQGTLTPKRTVNCSTINSRRNIRRTTTNATTTNLKKTA